MVHLEYPLYRSPWEATTQSTTAYEYSKSHTNPSPYTYTTTTRYNPYTRSTTQVVPFFVRTTDYNAINDYDKTKNRYGQSSSSAGTSTTTRRTNNYYNYQFNVYTSTTSSAVPVASSKLYGNTNNALLQQKITPIKYKISSTASWLASSINSDHNRLQSTPGRGKRNSEMRKKNCLAFLRLKIQSLVLYFVLLYSVSELLHTRTCIYFFFKLLEHAIILRIIR